MKHALDRAELPKVGGDVAGEDFADDGALALRGSQFIELIAEG